MEKKNTIPWNASRHFDCALALSFIFSYSISTFFLLVDFVLPFAPPCLGYIAHAECLCARARARVYIEYLPIKRALHYKSRLKDITSE